MPRKRALAMSQVREQWEAGTLRWENHRDVLHPFPARGQLDEYAERQEDEGNHHEGHAWSERDGPSSKEDTDIGRHCVGGVTPSLTIAQSVAVGEVCERVRQVDDMLEIARGLGNAHVVATLERARRTLLRQKAGATQLDPAVLAAAR